MEVITNSLLFILGVVLGFIGGSLFIVFMFRAFKDNEPIVPYSSPRREYSQMTVPETSVQENEENESEELTPVAKYAAALKNDMGLQEETDPELSSPEETNIEPSYQEETITEQPSNNEKSSHKKVFPRKKKKKKKKVNGDFSKRLSKKKEALSWSEMNLTDNYKDAVEKQRAEEDDAYNYIKNKKQEEG